MEQVYLQQLDETITLDAFPEQGWGSEALGFENWGESALDVTVWGVAATTSIGTVELTAEIMQ